MIKRINSDSLISYYARTKQEMLELKYSRKFAFKEDFMSNIFGDIESDPEDGIFTKIWKFFLRIIRGFINLIKIFFKSIWGAILKLLGFTNKKDDEIQEKLFTISKLNKIKSNIAFIRANLNKDTRLLNEALKDMLDDPIVNAVGINKLVNMFNDIMQEVDKGTISDDDSLYLHVDINSNPLYDDALNAEIEKNFESYKDKGLKALNIVGSATNSILSILPKDNLKLIDVEEDTGIIKFAEEFSPKLDKLADGLNKAGIPNEFMKNIDKFVELSEIAEEKRSKEMGQDEFTNKKMKGITPNSLYGYIKLYERYYKYVSEISKETAAAIKPMDTLDSKLLNIYNTLVNSEVIELDRDTVDELFKAIDSFQSSRSGVVNLVKYLADFTIHVKLSSKTIADDISRSEVLYGRIAKLIASNKGSGGDE